MEHFFPRIQVKTKKNTFFPRIQVQTCAQMHIFGGDVGEDHTQILGRDTVKLLGGYIPPPLGFRHPWLKPS